MCTSSIAPIIACRSPPIRRARPASCWRTGMWRHDRSRPRTGCRSGGCRRGRGRGRLHPAFRSRYHACRNRGRRFDHAVDAAIERGVGGGVRTGLRRLSRPQICDRGALRHHGTSACAEGVRGRPRAGSDRAVIFVPRDSPRRQHFRCDAGVRRYRLLGGNAGAGQGRSPRQRQHAGYRREQLQRPSRAVDGIARDSEPAFVFC